jgi:DNA-directed RNA polymerase subunit RPC12/RpoP
MKVDLRKVFRHVKHRKPSQIFCPRCASPKIHLFSGLDLWLTPRSYLCDDCGYRGLIVMELEKEKDEKQISEEKEEREVFGRKEGESV